MSKISKYRIVYGYVNDNPPSKTTIREGWWYICDNILWGGVYSPEGPFVSKVAATIRLRYMIKRYEQQLGYIPFDNPNEWVKNWGYVKKPTMRQAPLRHMILRRKYMHGY